MTSYFHHLLWTRLFPPYENRRRGSSSTIWDPLRSLNHSYGLVVGLFVAIVKIEGCLYPQPLSDHSVQSLPLSLSTGLSRPCIFLPLLYLTDPLMYVECENPVATTPQPLHPQPHPPPSFATLTIFPRTTRNQAGQAFICLTRPGPRSPGHATTPCLYHMSTLPRWLDQHASTSLARPTSRTLFPSPRGCKPSSSCPLSITPYPHPVLLSFSSSIEHILSREISHTPLRPPSDLRPY